jgi:hypothetical protein
MASIARACGLSIVMTRRNPNFRDWLFPLVLGVVIIAILIFEWWYSS